MRGPSVRKIEKTIERLGRGWPSPVGMNRGGRSRPMCAVILSRPTIPVSMSLYIGAMMIITALPATAISVWRHSPHSNAAGM